MKTLGIWSQVNRQNTACLYGVGSSGIIYYELYYNKSEPASSIEFKE